MERPEVLISGAGIAGCTLAYWLTRNGCSVTVVERSGALRSSGSPVDVRGPAVDVTERMKIAASIREAILRGSFIRRVPTMPITSSVIPSREHVDRSRRRPLPGEDRKSWEATKMTRMTRSRHRIELTATCRSR